MSPAVKKPSMKEMGATEAKAKFLSLLDVIDLGGEPVLVSKRGKRKIIMMPANGISDPLAKYKIGGGKIVGDIASPSSSPEDWEYD